MERLVSVSVVYEVLSEEGYSGGREVQGTGASGCETKGVEGEFKKSIMEI